MRGRFFDLFQYLRYSHEALRDNRMRAAVAALSSLEESVFAARSVLNHARDIHQTLALAGASLKPISTRPSRFSLLQASAITRALTLRQVQHEEYLDLVVAETFNQIGALEELTQDHRERLNYHLFLIQDRFESGKRDIEQKYGTEVEDLKQQISCKKAELNKLYEVQEGTPNLQERLDAVKEELKSLRLDSDEYQRISKEIDLQTLELHELQAGNSKRMDDHREQLHDLQVEVDRQSISIDQDAIARQMNAILKACGASNHALRAMKRIIVNSFCCRVSDFNEEFPSESDSAQQALRRTLKELRSLGFIHFPSEGMVAAGCPEPDL